MANITREEVLRLARNSRIHLSESEIENTIAQLGAVLGYAERVIEISGNGGVSSPKNINFLRPDEVFSTDARPILAQAPEVDESFFVVLPILDK